MPDTRPTVLIVGGGFCGAAVALHLLRDHPGLPADIVVVEPRARLGAGLAYGTADPEHRVNVAASRMSPFPEAPDHFDAWLRAQGEPAADPASVLPDGRLFPRRATFGRYVADTLAAHAGARGAPALRHLRGHATAARTNAAGVEVTLADGARVRGDALVLAVGHTAPDLPAALSGLRGAVGLVADPWDTAQLDAIDRAAEVLVVGTGLTACDVVASLRARGQSGRITMASRRGLLPRARTDLPVASFGTFDADPEATALALLRRVRRAVAGAEALGRPWEDVIAALREQARTVWGALPIPQRRRLLRHLRPFWDVHRFQCAPQIDALLHRERAAGRVVVLAATPVGSRLDADGTPAVTLRPRGTAAAAEHRFGAVVSCVGPGHRSVVSSNPVLRALHAAGTLDADPLALGIAVDRQSRVLGADGAANPRVFVAGPLARGQHGELMGLPQVSTQPREVAASVAALLKRARPGALPLDPAKGEPLESCT